MAATKGTASAIVVDEFIFNTATSSAEAALSAAELTTTNLDSAAHEYIPGLLEMSITQNGYFTGVDADGVEAELNARLGATGAVVAYIPDKATRGSPVYVIPDAHGKEMSISAPAADVITMNGAWGASSAGRRGALLDYEKTISATGESGEINIGSAGSNGGILYVHVHSISGTATSASIKLQSATTSGGSFSDEMTVTFSDVGAFLATNVGTTNKFLKYNCTSLGGATSFVVTIYSIVTGVTG